MPLISRKPINYNNEWYAVTILRQLRGFLSDETRYIVGMLEISPYWSWLLYLRELYGHLLNRELRKTPKKRLKMAPVILNW
jgi:hypothetical protein